VISQALTSALSVRAVLRWSGYFCFVFLYALLTKNTHKTTNCVLDTEHPELLKAADEAGCSPVVVAAINNQLDAIKHLVQAGALVDGKCRSGMTALMFAAQSGRLPAVKVSWACLVTS
jgi:hypothetical protein